MTTEARRRARISAAERAEELAAAISDLPSFIRSAIFMPTERWPHHLALEGLARVRDLYDHDLDAVHRPRLRALKAARRNRRCFIIGNGPSLASTDLHKLKDEVTFATNGFFLMMPKLDWSPTYFVVEDHLVGEDRADALNALSGTTKLFPASLAYALRADADTVYFDHRPRKSYPDGFDFSFDADVNTYTGGTVTFTCMQLAAYFGFQEIYLIGVDADYAIPADASLSGKGRVKEIDMRSDDPNHFHPDYFGKGKRWHEPNVEVMLGAYAEARRATETRGVSIVNATVGGKLEVFPRVDYEMLFRPAPAERLLVIDHTQIGDATATGEVKAAILGNWPSRLLMQLYDRKQRLHLAGGDADDGEVDGLDVADRIEAFDPDLVLYRPVPRRDQLHDFALDLIARTHVPLALWIVDDWPSSYAGEEPVAAARLEADFRWLLTRADACFSISPAMSAAFHERYGRLFVPIANGVDPADWAPARERPAGTIRVRYAGGLAENMTAATVGLVARAVEQLARGGLDISFEIKTHPHWQSTGAESIMGLEHTRVSTSDLSAADYRQWLADADILVIAYNFDDRSRGYIRYSLANKLPECLASGAAILAVGPDDVATIATLAELDVGERVTTPDERLVAAALRRLAASPSQRFAIARRAQALAFSLFGVRQVRQAFEASVGRVVAAHRAGDYPRDLHTHVDETAVVASLLEAREGADHVMLDVGAHNGSSAKHFDRLGWSIHCFEPHPARRKTLSARFADHENVRIDERAVADRPATAVALYDSEESSGITSLRPFHPSHREAGKVDVTTIAEVVAERGLSRIDFLKIDVEGLDLAVLQGVPWERLRPEVIECEFEDAKTVALGHTWRDIGSFLEAQGYTVYVSEWHPILRYGSRHDWRRLAPYSVELEIPSGAWGNMLAFTQDPGWATVRRAFDRHIERGVDRPAPPPARTAAIPEGDTPRPSAPEADTAPPAGDQHSAGAPQSPLVQRPLGARFARWLKPNAPTIHRVLRLGRRAFADLWRQRRWSIPAAAVLSIWIAAGFAPGMASVAWLVSGSGMVAAVALASLYATHRARTSLRRMSRDIARLRNERRADRQRLSQLNAKLLGLERRTAANELVAQRVRQLEDSLLPQHPGKGGEPGSSPAINGTVVATPDESVRVDA